MACKVQSNLDKIFAYYLFVAFRPAKLNGHIPRLVLWVMTTNNYDK